MASWQCNSSRSSDSPLITAKGWRNWGNASFVSSFLSYKHQKVVTHTLRASRAGYLPTARPLFLRTRPRGARKIRDVAPKLSRAVRLPSGFFFLVLLHRRRLCMRACARLARGGRPRPCFSSCSFAAPFRARERGCGDRVAVLGLMTIDFYGYSDDYCVREGVKSARRREKSFGITAGLLSVIFFRNSFMGEI